MKFLLLLPLLSLVVFTSSCRTLKPIDPMTGEPSCRCLPDNFRPDGTCDCFKVVHTK